MKVKNTKKSKIINVINRYKWFIIIIILALIFSFNVAGNDWSKEGLKMIPPTIGVLLGGLLSTIAIIFSLLKEDEIKLLYEKYGEKLINPFRDLKLHILLILSAMILSLLSFVLSVPQWIFSDLNVKVNSITVFNFIQLLCILITLASTIEVILVLFLIFEVKLIILRKKK